MSMDGARILFRLIVSAIVGAAVGLLVWAVDTQPDIVTQYGQPPVVVYAVGPMIGLLTYLAMWAASGPYSEEQE